MHYQCLIVDDERPLAESTAEYFTMFHVPTLAVFDENSCIKALHEHSFDLILLDINLEGTSGFDLCKRLREMTQIPILFISARTSDDDILMALHIGGDDYIQKPYSLSVLLAKVQAVLKRCNKRGEAVKQSGEIRVDTLVGRVYVGDKEVKLKALEYRLLLYMIEHKGKQLSKEELFKNVWEDVITSDGTLNVHIRHLREKIEADPNNPRYIKTIWGVGYRFEDIQ